MARIVVKLARSAGLASVLRRRRPRHCERRALRVLRRSGEDLRARRLRAEHHHARLCARRRVVGEFAMQRREVIPYDAISPKLRQAIIAAEDDEFEQHFGLSIPRIVVTLMKDIAERAQGGRRQHADPAARAQAVPHRREDVGAQDPRGDPRDPDREALHQAGDLHALRQPDVLRPRRLRRRGGVAPVLRQVGQGPRARGGGDDRRHPPEQRPPEPVREHGGGAAAAQLHARPHGRRRLHHPRTGRRRPQEADRDARRAVRAAFGRAVLHRGSAQGARSSATAPSSSTRTA